MEKSLLLKELPASSWPRERLLKEGEKHLTDQELLAIILRNGTRSQHVMDLAGLILKEVPNLYDLKQLSIEELMNFKGIGKTKAIELKAVIEFKFSPLNIFPSY